MNVPLVPISWGELWDRVAILRIKASRLRSNASRQNAVYELNCLTDIAGSPSVAIVHLVASLLAINLRLWCVEDLIREREAAADFGPTFVALARSVYLENDERGRIKAEINRTVKSDVVEEKQYSPYVFAP